jgi:peptide/nickel transport system ATP-binding protein
MPDLLTINNLSIDFRTGNKIMEAVKNISLKVKHGEVLAIVGESGSGKSVTSLSILQLLPSPPAFYKSGSIMFSEDGFNCIDLLKTGKMEIQQVRGNKIGMIFQEPMTSLNPVMSCGKQVMETLLTHKKITIVEAREQTIEWFRKVQLTEPEQMFNKFPHQLSGGQKQRVMIAIAMCCKPFLLICDEPTTALDVTVQKSILLLLKQLQQQHNMGIIFISHDLGVVAEIADRIAIMYKGALVEQGDMHTIFKNAQHPYTKALIACRPSFHSKGQRLPTVDDVLNENKVISLENSTVITEIGSDLIRVNNVSVIFPGKRNFLGKPQSWFKAVDNVSFEIEEGETLGLVGESGCGKTTLGRTILKLIEPVSGSIYFRNKNIMDLTGYRLKEFRKNAQLIFQDPFSSLNPRMTIGEAIEEPVKNTHIETDPIKIRKLVRQILEKVGLTEYAINRYPHEFSGGQRQRIVIARALALGPQFLVCDESVSALDVSVQAQVLNLLNDLKKDLGLTMLFISHDLSVVRYMCDRIMVMNKGKIIESGIAEDIYNHPKEEYTRKLLIAVPTL